MSNRMGWAERISPRKREISATRGSDRGYTRRTHLSGDDFGVFHCLIIEEGLQGWVEFAKDLCVDNTIHVLPKTTVDQQERKLTKTKAGKRKP